MNKSLYIPPFSACFALQDSDSLMWELEGSLDMGEGGAPARRSAKDEQPIVK